MTAVSAKPRAISAVNSANIATKANGAAAVEDDENGHRENRDGRDAESHPKPAGHKVRGRNTDRRKGLDRRNLVYLSGSHRRRRHCGERWSTASATGIA